METVGDRIARAQAAGDLAGIRAALLDARAAGADPAQIETALAEVSRLEAMAQAGPEAPSPSGAPAGPVDEAAAAEAAAAAEEVRQRARAEALKKQGNEQLKESTKSAARNALDCFTAGLEVRCTDRVLNAQLHSNRAHVRMLLRQFVEAVDDCRRAIELDPKNIKAYWRAAKASMHLDLVRSALEFCESGLLQAPQDPDLQKLRDTCAEKLAIQQQRRSELAAMAPPPERGERPGDFSADEAMQIQDRVSEFGEQIDALKHSILMKQREHLKAKLTRTSVQEAPAEARLYHSVGRAFVTQERSSIEQSLTVAIDSLEAEIPKLVKTLQGLEKRKEGAEKELQEMIRAFKQQAERGAAAAA